MSDSESEEFFRNMFGKININVASEAMFLMAGLSGGLPMLMHEIGDAVFWQNTDNHIDEKDALIGIQQAAQAVGRKYIDHQVSKLLRSKSYSLILRIIHKKAPVGGWFNRRQILEALPSTEQKNLDNFLQRGRKPGIIQMTEVRGEYKFVNPLHQLYAWSEVKKIK